MGPLRGQYHSATGAIPLEHAWSAGEARHRGRRDGPWGRLLHSRDLDLPARFHKTSCRLPGGWLRSGGGQECPRSVHPVVAVLEKPKMRMAQASLDIQRFKHGPAFHRPRRDRAPLRRGSAAVPSGRLLTRLRPGSALFEPEIARAVFRPVRYTSRHYGNHEMQDGSLAETAVARALGLRTIRHVARSIGRRVREFRQAESRCRPRA